MTLIVRPARPRDIAALHGLIRALAAFHGDIATISLERTQELFIGGVATALLACEGEAVLGYAACLPRLRLDTGAEVLDIQQLYVCEQARSRGIGRALIAAACELGRARGMAEARIGTHPANKGAQAAYRALALAELPPPGPQFRIALG